MLKHRLLAVRRTDDSDDMLRIWNMGTHQRTRKNDTIDATQNAPTHHTNKKKILKDRELKVKTRKEFDNIDSVSHNDQDSDVSFESDNDEEIDAAEIEEEDWVDCIKKSTNEAIVKM